MDYYKEIKNLSNEELHEYIKNRIEELELESKDYNEGIETIGNYIGYNPTYQLVDNRIFVDSNCFYGGYIPLGIKMVYGTALNLQTYGLVGNDGKYYYLDTDDYVYEFCEWIQDKDVRDEFEFCFYLECFLKKYFGVFSEINREEMFTMIYKDDLHFFPPVKEHGFSWFKGKGNAMCTEYAIAAQNILSFFGIEAYFMMGAIVNDGSRAASHAFNFVSYKDSHTLEEKNALIDFSLDVSILDWDNELIGKFPFVGYLEKLDDEFFSEIYDDEKRIVFKDYVYGTLGDDIFRMYYESTREYYYSNKLLLDTFKNCKEPVKILK